MVMVYATSAMLLYSALLAIIFLPFDRIRIRGTSRLETYSVRKVHE